jgi:hypothetical protein
MKGICFQTPLALLYIPQKFAHYRDIKDFCSIEYKFLPYWTSVFNSDTLDTEGVLFCEASLSLPCIEFLFGEDPLFCLPRCTHFLINCRSSCITWDKDTGVAPESPRIKNHHFTFPVILLAIMCMHMGAVPDQRYHIFTPSHEWLQIFLRGCNISCLVLVGFSTLSIT